MTDSHGIARDQLRAFVERIERLEEEKKTIADDIKDVYGEAKSSGFDTKILKMVISLRKKDEQERTEQELILDAYLQALGMIPQFEASDAARVTAAPTRSPAMALQSPRKAAEAVSERTAITDATVAPVLVEADKAEAVAGGLGQPDMIPALTVQHDGVNVGGPERADVTDRRDDHLNSPSDDDAISEVNGKAGLENAAGVEPSSSASPFTAEQPDAGGDHVAEPQHAATHQAGGLVKVTPATFTLRPNCRNPGPTCGGHGSNHCHVCKMAARELETA